MWDPQSWTQTLSLQHEPIIGVSFLHRESEFVLEYLPTT